MYILLALVSIIFDQADLEGLTSLVLLDLSQNNIDNVAQRFVHTVMFYSSGTNVLKTCCVFVNNKYVSSFSISDHSGIKRTYRYPQSSCMIILEN